jgi:hypothetical protein
LRHPISPADTCLRELLTDEVTVAFKVNYGLKKAERDRAKKAKKEAKARDRDSAAPTLGEPDQAALGEGDAPATPAAEQ